MSQQPICPPTFRCAILKSVEHTCSQCHSAVADAAPFCTNCGAPQIRFSPREASTVPILVGAGPLHSITTVDTQPSAVQPQLAFDRRARWRAAINAGTVAAVLSLVPGLAVLALPLAGFICVLLYRRSAVGEEVPPAAGFRLGARSGVVGFIIVGVVRLMLVVTAHQTVGTAAIEAVQQARSIYNDQQVRETIELLKTPAGLAFCLIIGGVMTCVIFVILSGIGGAVSAALLRRKLPPH